MAHLFFILGLLVGSTMNPLSPRNRSKDVRDYSIINNNWLVYEWNDHSASAPLSVFKLPVPGKVLIHNPDDLVINSDATGKKLLQERKRH